MSPGSLQGNVRAAIEDQYGPHRWLQPAWRAIAAEVALERGAFLDLAAGFGWVCIHVAAGKPELDAVGVVPCSSRRARAERNRERRLNCTFKDMPLTQLTFPDDTFDVVLAMGCAGDWTDTTAILTEVHRTLKPGGRLMVYDPQPGREIPSEWVERQGPWPPAQALRAWIKRRGMTDDKWTALKQDVKASAFKGGEEGSHGFFRRLVLKKA